MDNNYVTKAMLGKIKDVLKDHPRELQYLELLIIERDRLVKEKLEILLTILEEQNK